MRLGFRIALLMAALAGSLGCGRNGVHEQMTIYRSEIETALGVTPDRATAGVSVGLPSRRDRRLAVRDQRIGPFDFLAILGCQLSEVVAARNGVLGQVLEPTRRLAHEIAVIDAIEACLPSLSPERARDLRAHLELKRSEFSVHAWNAVWLDDDLERYLSGGPRSIIGGSDARDGARQLGRAAEALTANDVGGVEEAFSALRDDTAVGPLLFEWASAAIELERVSTLVSSLPAARCDLPSRRLARIFRDRYVPYQAAIGSLERDGRNLVEGLQALFRVSSQGVDVPDAMAAFSLTLFGDEARPGLPMRARTALLAHAKAWGPLLEVCGVIPRVEDPEGGAENA